MENQQKKLHDDYKVPESIPTHQTYTLWTPHFLTP